MKSNVNMTDFHFFVNMILAVTKQEWKMTRLNVSASGLENAQFTLNRNKDLKYEHVPVLNVQQSTLGKILKPYTNNLTAN